MSQLFNNNATTTLAASKPAGATSMLVQPGTGSRFPAITAPGDFFNITLYKIVDGLETSFEIVKVTARSVDTFTIVGAQDNTPATSFGVGDQVSMRLTAAWITKTEALDAAQDELIAGIADKADKNALAASSGAGLIGVADGRTLADLIVSDGLFNGGTRKFTRWQAALARARVWGGRAGIAVVGNSVPAGVGSNGGDGQTDSRKNAWPTVFADALTKLYNGFARADSIWGDSFAGSNISTFDPRLTMGTGWGVSNIFCLGGNVFINQTTTSGSANALSFEPTVPTDRCDIYYIKYPGYSQFSTQVNNNGTNLGTFDSAGAEGMGKATITAALGQNRWDINKVNAGVLLITGIDAYQASACRTSVWNMGASGSTAHDWAKGTAPYDFRNALPFVAPDLTIISLCINDWAGLPNSVPALYKADMKVIIDAGKVSGDVLLMVDIPSNVGTASLESQELFRQYCYQLSIENDVPLYDMTYRWRSQSYRPELGRYYDGAHPSQIGAADIAYIVARLVGNT